MGEDPSQPDDGQFDYVVVVLKDRIRRSTGWLCGTYDNADDNTPIWWHAGYSSEPPFVSRRPTYEDNVELDGVTTRTNTR